MDRERLQPIVDRWLVGQATEADLDVLRATLLPGRIDTGGGAAVLGSVHLGSGSTFVGRDQIVNKITHTFNLDRAAAELLLNRLYPPTRHTLRAPVGDFTGRDAEIAQLMKVLQGNDQTGRVAMIRGMGGVGKTELALLVAQRLTPAYPDAQLLLELQTGEQALPPEALLRGVIRAFHPQAQIPDEPAVLRGLYRQSVQGTRGLLVLDNASSAAQIRPLLPPPPGWVVLVTSRERFPMPGALSLDLDVMNESEALTLLARFLRDGNRANVANHPELVQLAGLCGRLPLALRLAAGFLTTAPNWTLERYLATLREKQLERLKVGGESVEHVLGLSVARLDEDAPALGVRWRQLGVMVAPFDEHAAAAVWALAEDEALDGLTTLLQRSLLDYDQATQSYSLHDLLRQYALADCPIGLEQVPRRHANYFLALGRMADNLYEQGGARVLESRRMFDRAWPHLLSAWTWMKQRAEIDARRWVADFPLVMPHVLDMWATPQELIPLLEACAAVRGEIGDHRGEGNILGNLGVAYYRLGDVHRAIEFFEKHLEITRQLGDLQGEGKALGNLGVAYANRGDTELAIEAHSRRLEIARQLGDWQGEQNALGNLGTIYHRLGDVHRAIEFYEQQLKIARDSDDPRAEATGLGNLGAAYDNLGEAHRAIEFYEQDLTIARRIGDRRGEGATLGNLGLAYANLGEVRRAIEFYEQRIEIARQIGDRRGEGAALGNLGNAYYRLGDVSRAIEFYGQHLEIARQIGDRWGEVLTSWNLGLACDQLGEHSRACTLMRIRVDYEREIGHPDAEGHATALAAVERKINPQREQAGPGFLQRLSRAWRRATQGKSGEY